MVFATLREAGVPTAVTLAGGYARRQDDTVEIHCNTVRTAATAGGTSTGQPGREEQP